jgi:hypothetical protein
MKKFIKPLKGLLIALSLAGIDYELNAQTDATKYDPRSLYTLSLNSSFPKISTAWINIRVIRNFTKKNPQAEDVKWTQSGNYYFVHFRTGEVKQKTVYDKKGNEDYSLKILDEQNLPRDVRAVVKSIYYDYRITTVEELKLNRKTIYLVHLSGNNSWKSIRICEGQLEEIEALVEK